MQKTPYKNTKNTQVYQRQYNIHGNTKNFKNKINQ